jgi:hypothetical protein
MRAETGSILRASQAEQRDEAVASTGWPTTVRIERLPELATAPGTAAAAAAPMRPPMAMGSRAAWAPIEARPWIRQPEVIHSLAAELRVRRPALVSAEQSRRRGDLPKRDQWPGSEPAGYPRLRDRGVSSGALWRPPQDVLGGQPLSPGVRGVMERLLGQDFGRVRAHSGPEAARAAVTLKADAFTAGRDIFLGREGTTLSAPSRMALLGHELTHVAHRQSLGGRAGPGLLESQSEEREAAANELVVRQAFATGGPLALRTPGQSPAAPRGSQREEGGGDTGAMTALPQRLIAVAPDAPPMALARAAVGRDTADSNGASSSQAPTQEGSSASEPSATQQSQEGRRDVDVDAVAQQVYDLIVRRLAVERERAGYL